MDQALGELQGTLGDSANKTEAYQAAIELFGAKAGPAIADACMDGRLSFEELGTSMQDYAGTVDQTFEDTLDPLDKTTTTMNTLKELGAELVDTAAPMIQTAMEKLRDVIQELKDKWDGLSPATQDAILKAAAIAAAVGPIVMIIGGIISGIGSIITVIGLLFSPITLLVAGIVGLIAIGGYLIANWEEVKATAENLKAAVAEKWEAIKTKIADSWENIKTKTAEAWDNVKDKVVTTAGNIRDGAVEKFNALKETAANTWGSVKSAAGTAWENIKETITGKIESAKEKVRGIIDTIKGFFAFDWKLPDLKLPHIVVGSYIDIPVIGTIPDPTSLRVDWYKKAYNNPIMFTRPTVLQTPYGAKDSAMETEEKSF